MAAPETLPLPDSSPPPPPVAEAPALPLWPRGTSPEERQQRAHVVKLLGIIAAVAVGLGGVVFWLWKSSYFDSWGWPEVIAAVLAPVWVPGVISLAMAAEHNRTASGPPYNPGTHGRSHIAHLSSVQRSDIWEP